MRLYEIVYIFDPALDEAGVNALLEKHHGRITDAGGEISAVDHWGMRQLAYPVARQTMGYYAVTHFHADPEALVEFERQLKLDEQVLRYLIVLNEGEPTTGLSVVAERPPRAEDADASDDDDDDDDEDEDEESDTDSPPEFSGGRGRRRRHEGPAITLLNYKDVSTLSRFLTEAGKILPKRTTKVNAAFQRSLGRAVKRARFLALIPYIRDHEA